MANEALSPMAELLSKAAYHFSAAQPFMPMYAHLLISALFPIFTGAHASLSRPSSADRPPKKSKGTVTDDDEEVVQKMEGLSPKDALLFPLLAGSTLVGLYMLIKYAGADMLNKILRWYFSSIGVFSIGKLLSDGLNVVYSFVWPTYYTDQGRLWRVDGSRRLAMSEEVEGFGQTKTSPLPGQLSSLPLHASSTRQLWRLRRAPKRKYILNTHLYHVWEIKMTFTPIHVLSFMAAIVAIAYGNLAHMPWWLTNLQGFAVCYSALQFLSPTTFGTGSLILAALFFYDIYFVFFTPMMVTVAKSLDVPIKLMFPRPDEMPSTAGEPPIKSYGMLGLGDIVLPGIMIGLALRFDLYLHYLRKQQRVSRIRSAMDSENSEADSEELTIEKAKYIPATSRWGDRFWTKLSLSGSDRLPTVTEEMYDRLKASRFSKVYFTASIAGYVVGMLATLGVMSVFQHAQPALLYLVPGVLISLWGTALVKGEWAQMWEFSEETEKDEEEKKANMVSTAEEKAEVRNWWQNVWESVVGRDDSSRKYSVELAMQTGECTKEATSDANATSNPGGYVKEKEPNDTSATSDNVLFSFSVSRHTDTDHASVGSDEQTPGDAEQATARGAKAEEDHSSTASESSSDDTVLVGSADLDIPGEQKPVWRGSSGIPQAAQKGDDRAGKRVRLG